MVVYDSDIPVDLILDLVQICLLQVITGKYTFCLKGTTNVSIKELNNKRQITATFVVSVAGVSSPIQLIFNGKTECCHKHEPNYCSFFKKSDKDFIKISYPNLWKLKPELGKRAEQQCLIAMYSLKRKDNETLKELCHYNHFNFLIVWNNVTNNSQLLDVSVNIVTRNNIVSKYGPQNSDFFSFSKICWKAMQRPIVSTQQNKKTRRATIQTTFLMIWLRFLAMIKRRSKPRMKKEIFIVVKGIIMA